MINIQIDKEQRRKIFLAIKPYFKEKLGKYTHQRISDEWHFYGLGFVRDEMTYVFGFNIGFFKKEILPNQEYSHVGMNVLVRTNGLNPELRAAYQDFFKENLSDWLIGAENSYTSFRGGLGSEFPRYKKITEFNSEEEIMLFLEDCINGIYKIYPKIADNPGKMFTHIVRGAPPWHDTLLQLVIDQSGIVKK